MSKDRQDGRGRREETARATEGASGAGGGGPFFEGLRGGMAGAPADSAPCTAMAAIEPDEAVVVELGPPGVLETDAPVPLGTVDAMEDGAGGWPVVAGRFPLLSTVASPEAPLPPGAMPPPAAA